MTQTFCLGCKQFFDKRHRNCPECDRARPAFNAGLVSQQWASNLNWQRDHALKN